MSDRLTSHLEPDRERTRDILANWRAWARDLPRESCEINYYTISPAFRGTKWAKPTPKHVVYDEKSAEMAEDVLREMFKWQPKAREWIIGYWIYMPNYRILSAILKMSRRNLIRKMNAAHDAFSRHWGLLFMKVDR